VSTARQTSGTLFLVPTPLDFGTSEAMPLETVLPAATWQRAAGLTHWITENAKSTRAFLNRVGALTPLAAPLAQQHLVELPRAVHKKGDHLGEFDACGLLAPAVEGHDMGLVSEAGMPAIADPGASVVRAAHVLGLRVVPLVGPISLMLALAASGLNGQHFAFVGYLPQEALARTQRLQALEQTAQRTGQTQLWIETPYRNQAHWESLLLTLRPQTLLLRASGLTLPDAQVRCQSVAQWRAQKESHPPLDAPTVFGLGVAQLASAPRGR